MNKYLLNEHNMRGAEKCDFFLYKVSRREGPSMADGALSLYICICVYTYVCICVYTDIDTLDMHTDDEQTISPAIPAAASPARQDAAEDC